MMSPISLQYRLSKRLVTGIATVLLVFTGALGALLVRDQSLEFDRSLESKARALLDLTPRRGATVDFTEGRLVELKDGQQTTFFAIHSGGSSLLRGRGAPGAAAKVEDDALILGTPVFENVRLPSGATGRQVAIGFLPDGSSRRRGIAPVDGAPVDLATVIVAAPRAPLLWKAARTGLTLLSSCALLLVALWLLVRNALRRGLEPVVGLRRQIETLGPSHRGQRVSLQAPPEELAPVLRHINELLDRSEVPVAGDRRAAS